MSSYGSTATLFTLGRNHSVQQYDITPNSVPMLVAEVQHVPANTPPTPPTTLEEMKNPYSNSRTTISTDAPALPSFTDTSESGTDEGGHMSPLQKIAQEMDSLDALESEIRDKVMPLSPASSRTSSVSSRSSGNRRRGRKYLYDRPDSSRASSTTGYGGTEFSFDGGPSALSARQGHESMSIRSVSSVTSNSRQRTSNLRKEIMRSPHEAAQISTLDLFPRTRARLRDVPFRTPHYGNVVRTPELLQREMLSVIFGWNDTARALIRDELQRLKSGSASGVLLSRWLGEIGADDMASMVGSESMSSSDWMLLALSSIGMDSQKKVGEAFVQRLLEKGDVHPAVAILLGLGENNDAIEVYVTQQYWLESVLLTCLTCPADWGRISFLIRKWGETAMQKGHAELAVRCFSCTSVETSEPWFSPRAQDAVYAAQQERFTQPLSAGGMTSPPISPPSRSGSGRLAAKNAALKLITTFGDKAAPTDGGPDDPTPMGAIGTTPIAQSALSPGVTTWQEQRSRNTRDPSSARTATPSAFSRRKRLPSNSEFERAKQGTANLTTPITTTRDSAPTDLRGFSRRTSSIGSVKEPPTALKATAYNDRLAPASIVKDDNHLPSPAQGVFARLREESHTRHPSRERKPDGLEVRVMETLYDDNFSPVPSTSTSLYSTGTGPSRASALSPPLTGNSIKSAKGRAIDEYISSIDAAREQAREKRAQSRRRGESRKRDENQGSRGTSRAREPSETRGRHHNVRYIKPAKRSPSSPVPMSPEDIAQASHSSKADPATTDDESFYKVTSPVDSHKSMRSGRSEPKWERRRPSIEPANDMDVAPPRTRSRAASRQRSPEGGRLRTPGGRGRSQQRKAGSVARSPSSPLSMPAEAQNIGEQDGTNSDGLPVRLRAGSRNNEDLQSRRADSRDRRDRRERSSSRKPAPIDEAVEMRVPNVSKDSFAEEQDSVSSLLMTYPDNFRQPRGLSRKQLAAKELEDRRLSLARRPSAPQIPMPVDRLPGNVKPGAARPPMGQRSHTEFGNSASSYTPQTFRSQTVDPEQMGRYGKMTDSSSVSATPIGLPATPRAMRHPRYMGSDWNERDAPPPVPEIPDNASLLSSVGSTLLSHGLGSTVLSQVSFLPSEPTQLSQVDTGDDAVAPLLPSSVFGQKQAQVLPPRSASVPAEQMSGVHPAYKAALPHSNRRLSHVRKISPPDTSQVTATNPTAGLHSSIDEALAGSTDQVFIVPEPPTLPELQHLAGPPPPPPPPTMYGLQNGLGVIDIAIDNNASPSAVDVPTTLPSSSYPQPMDRATTASPSMHRRGTGSVSDTFGSRFRGFGDRMRSTSRSRAKSPQQDYQYNATPYETVLPPVPSQHQHHESLNRAKSPYEQAMAAQGNGSQEWIPPPPPPPSVPVPGYETRLQETTIPPSTLPTRTQSAQGGYRNPKEIRANMPPETLQQGVYGSGGFL